MINKSGGANYVLGLAIEVSLLYLPWKRVILLFYDPKRQQIL